MLRELSRMLRMGGAPGGAGEERGTVVVDGESLMLWDLVRLGSGEVQIGVMEPAWEKLRASRAVVDRIVESHVPTYGINTGFGLLSHTNVDPKDLNKLQDNLVRSHAAGVGPPLPLAHVRRIMALRINTLAKGHSGVSPHVLEGLLALFNSGVVPKVPEQGTVGASGDLAPLAHIGLALIGDGEVWDPAVADWVPAADALARHGLEPAKLRAKDGLSLINGTQFILGVGSIALETAIRCAKVSHAVAAMSLCAMQGHPAAMDPRVADIRPHAGQRLAARLMRKLVPLGESSVTTTDVQDAYSIRCIPQVHGPALEAMRWVQDQLEVEMNSSTDNPLVFVDEPHLVSAGNFHGEFPAKAMDTLALYAGELGRISVARAMLMVDPNRNRGLPSFLSQDAGLNSGFMAWEISMAAIDAENRTLSMPASAETIPTSAGKEDHVSMGGFAARKAVQIADNVEKILAMELMLATHAIHDRRAHDPDFPLPEFIERVYQECAVRSPIAHRDRVFSHDMELIHEYLIHHLAHEDFLTGVEQNT